MTGIKTFSVAVVAEMKKTKMPVFQFSYFDPLKKAYVTLASDNIPLTVEGNPLAAQAPAAPSSTNPAEKPQKSEDILTIFPTRGFWGFGWNPPAAVWYGVMFSPVPLLAIGLAARGMRGDAKRRRRAQLLKERAAFLAKAKEATDRADLYDAAARVLQIEVALRSDSTTPSMVEESAVLARQDTPSLRKIFEARTQYVYAGGASGAASANERDEVLDALEQFGKLA